MGEITLLEEGSGLHIVDIDDVLDYIGRRLTSVTYKLLAEQ